MIPLLAAAVVLSLGCGAAAAAVYCEQLIMAAGGTIPHCAECMKDASDGKMRCYYCKVCVLPDHLCQTA